MKADEDDSATAATSPNITKAERIKKKQKSDWLLGCLFIFLVAVIWNLGTIVVQFIFDELHYREPYVLTYIGTALFSIYLPVWGIAVKSKFRLSPKPLPWRYPNEKFFTHTSQRVHPPPLLSNPDDQPAYTTNSTSEPINTSYNNNSNTYNDTVDNSNNNNNNNNNIDNNKETPLPPLSHFGLFRIACVICPMWFIANCLYNYSLSYTTNTSSTIISTTSSLFTFVLSMVFANEKFTPDKLLAVCLCIGGTSIVALDDHSDHGSSKHSKGEKLFGDILAIASAFTYGSYTTALRVMCPDDSRVAMSVLFGYIGAVNSVVFGLILLTLVMLGLISKESVTTQLSFAIVGAVVATGLVDNVISDYLWARACLLTTPTVATVGLSLTVPLAFVSDVLLHHTGIRPLHCVGALLVVFGFVVVNNIVTPVATLRRLLVQSFSSLLDFTNHQQKTQHKSDKAASNNDTDGDVQDSVVSGASRITNRETRDVAEQRLLSG